MFKTRTYMKQIFAIGLALFSVLTSTAQVILTGNPIVIENALPGNPMSEWSVPDFRDNRIAGYSTKISLNAGETVRFKINVQGGANYTLKIYRLGYYNGDGARLHADLGTLTGIIQPQGISDPATGLYDCGNWTESASWDIPGSAVSGLYIAKLERTGGGSNHIVFIVRNDASHSDLYMQFPDATWQAYNGYGGNNFYDGTTSYIEGHAVKISYNRPIFSYNTLFNTHGKGSDWYMNAEYPMVRWLERNGYDITYTSNNDVHRNGARILNHKVFISVGHDEYWSKQMRENVEHARNNGVHLAFFTGNEVYWKTRYEDCDGSGSEDRTIVCYKEGFLGNGGPGERACGYKCDESTSEWTGLWRTGADYDGGRPENELVGQISWTESLNDFIEVPSYYKKLRFWRNTSIASLGAGQIGLLGAETLGYEWNYEQPQYKSWNPPGRITLSSTTLNNLTHKLSLYRHPSGALVFGAGTVQWSWGLDSKHWGGTTQISKIMQQATVNLFADMGVQPESLQGNLVQATQSTDYIAPTSTITSPPNGSVFPARAPITISGTATDAAVVAGIEVSVDGGVTWDVAEASDPDGNVTWSYTFTPASPGTVSIKTRGFDDSGNMEIPGTGISLTIGPPGYPFTIFEESSTPAQHYMDPAINLGVRFKPNLNGFITGVRFYKGPNNDGTHVGSLWASDGSLLAQVTFTNESATGWQQANFSTPVAVTAGNVYTVSYFSPSGNFSITQQFFATNGYPIGPPSSWPLQALPNPDGGNGVYSYGSESNFPSSSYNAANYFVDVVFTNTLAVPANLNGTVTLQGRPPAPHAFWQVPLTVSLYIPGNYSTPAYTYNVNTDQNGNFTIADLPLGTFTITVKNQHTLKRVKYSQTIGEGNNNIDFGTLLEGDATRDNTINILDLSLLANAYGKSFGESGYDPRADFTNNSTINVFDLSVLANNFFKTGENP